MGPTPRCSDEPRSDGAGVTSAAPAGVVEPVGAVAGAAGVEKPRAGLRGPSPSAHAFGVLPVVGATGQFRTCPGRRCVRQECRGDAQVCRSSAGLAPMGARSVRAAPGQVSVETRATRLEPGNARARAVKRTSEAPLAEGSRFPEVTPVRSPAGCSGRETSESSRGVRRTCAQTEKWHIDVLWYPSRRGGRGLHDPCSCGVRCRGRLGPRFPRRAAQAARRNEGSEDDAPGQRDRRRVRGGNVAVGVTRGGSPSE